MARCGFREEGGAQDPLGFWLGGVGSTFYQDRNTGAGTVLISR